MKTKIIALSTARRKREPECRTVGSKAPDELVMPIQKEGGPPSVGKRRGRVRTLPPFKTKHSREKELER